MELDRALLMELLVAEGLDAVLVGRPWDTTVQPTVSYLVGHLLPVWDYSGLFVLLRRTEPPIVIANAWCSPDPTGQLEVRTYPGHHMRFALPVLSATLQEVGLDHARI